LATHGGSFISSWGLHGAVVLRDDVHR
jgi:hypothetical protein